MEGEGKERLRFAVAMRGGVSLAVWIGGALHEIRSLSAAEGALQLTRYTAVDVDVLTGASAGGLNAALAGIESARGGSLSMRDVWLGVADIDRLLDQQRPAPPGGWDRRSVLNGDYFLDQLDEQLAAVPVIPAQQRPVEVFLAATVLAGNVVTDPSDASFSDRRSEAYFHYRHIGNHAAFSDFVEADAPLRLARAARSTASFPAAFEPVEIDLASASGTLHFDGPPPAQAQTVHLYDGGIVDNIPVERAILAVADAPSHQRVRRWLLYLHPSPDVRQNVPGAAPSPTTLPGVVRDLLGAAGHETLLDDLAALRANNEQVAVRMTNLVSTAQAALAGVGPAVSPNPMPDVDAYRLYALLDAPDAAMCWRPIGTAMPPSPIADLGPGARYDVRQALATSVCAQPSSVRPFARIVRHAHTTIAWIRWRERNGGLVAPEQRRLVYDVLTVARLVDAALDRATVTSPIPALIADRVQRLAEVESSGSMLAIANALVGLPAADDLEPLIQRLAASDPALATALGVLASGELPADAGGSGVALSGQLRSHLAGVAASLGFDPAGAPLAPGAAVSVFTILRDHLGPGPATEAVLDALDRIDLADIGSHRGRAIGLHQTLHYRRISGAQSSPLADPGVLPLLGLRFPDGSPLVGPIGAGGMNPSSKLSGNALANFSAFFSKRFRANDWMWGRLDAAAALADLLIRPEHLSPGLTAAAVATYLGVTADEADDTPVDRVMRAAWFHYENDVEAELVTGDDPETLRALVTLHWQLGILDTELPTVFESPLDVGGEPATDPMPPGTAVPPDPTPAPGATPSPPGAASVERWRQRLTAYAGLERSVIDLWGRSRSVALGVRVVRNATTALFPGAGVARVMRSLVGASLLVVMSAFVNPATFLAGVNLLCLLVVVPRATGAFAGIALALSAVTSVPFWWLLVRRAHRRRRIPLGVGLPVKLSLPVFSGALMVSLHLLAGLRLLRPAEPDSWRAVPGWSAPEHSLHPGQILPDRLVNPFAVALVVLIASVVLWSWAKPRWRGAVAVAAALLMGGFTLLSDTHRAHPSAWIRVGTSLWTGAALVLILTTIVALWSRPEDRPQTPGSAAAPSP